MLLNDDEQVTDVINIEVFSSSPLSCDWYSLFSVTDSWPIVVVGELCSSELKEKHT